MAEEYTFNIKLKLNTEISDPQTEKLDEILSKASKLLEDLNSLDIKSLKGAYSTSGTASKQNTYRLDLENQFVENQIEQLRAMRSFTPLELKPTQPFASDYTKKEEISKQRADLRKEIDSQYHSSLQATEEFRRSMQQQRQLFLQQFELAKQINKPTTTSTFSGEHIQVIPERTLQQMVAPDIFTKQLEQQLNKLLKAPQDEIGKEALRVKRHMDSIYDEVNKALGSIEYEAHQRAQGELDALKHKIDTLVSSGDIKQITQDIDKSIQSGDLLAQFLRLKESVNEASDVFASELGAELDKTRKSFENFQRNIIFQFNYGREKFFDPAGSEFRDVASLSSRKGQGSPIGGRYVGAPRISFDDKGNAFYEIYDVKSMAREASKLMDVEGLSRAFGEKISRSLQKDINAYLEKENISRRVENLVAHSVDDLQKIKTDLLKIAETDLVKKFGIEETRSKMETLNKGLDNVTRQALVLPSVHRSPRGAAIIRDPDRSEYFTLGKYVEARPGINEMEDRFIRPLMEQIKRAGIQNKELPRDIKDLPKLVKDFWVRSRPREEHGVGIGIEEASKETLQRVKSAFDQVESYLVEKRGAARSAKMINTINELKAEFEADYNSALREAIRTTQERTLKERYVSGDLKLPDNLESEYRNELKPYAGKGVRYKMLPVPIIEFLQKESQAIGQHTQTIPTENLEQKLEEVRKLEQEHIGKSDYSDRSWQRTLEDFGKYRQIDFYNMLNRAASYSRDQANELQKLRNSLSSAGRLENDSYFQELMHQQFKKVFDPIKEKVPEEHEAMQKHEVYGMHKVTTIQPQIPQLGAGPSSFGPPVDLQAKKRFITERNLEMEELFEKEFLRGIEAAQRKLGPNIERLATVGLNEAAAIGSRDFGDRFMEAFFKGKLLQPFASYDPRETEAFGYSINPARPTGAAWDALAGPEFNALRSRKAHEFIKKGQWGSYGTGLNVVTVLKDVSQGYEDLYEIGPRLQELATFKFKKMVVPSLKGTEQELKGQVIKYLQEIGHDLFGAAISSKELADETYINDIVKRWAQSPQGPIQENVVELLNTYLGHEARKVSTGQVLKGVGATAFGRISPEAEESAAEKAKRGLFPKLKFTDVGMLRQVPKSFEELTTEIIETKKDLDPDKAKKALELIRGTGNLLMTSSEHLKKLKMQPIEYATGKLMGEEGVLTIEERRQFVSDLLGLDLDASKKMTRAKREKTQVKYLEEDMNKLREAYSETVGQDLLKSVPVDLRMSASGIGKASRMIGGNLAEIIANNIVGNLRPAPLKGETLLDQIKRQPLAKVQIGDTASGLEAKKLAELYKESFGLKGKYGEEFIYEQDGQLEKAIAGMMHVMIMKEPKAWVPKNAAKMVSGESKMTIDPHGWFGLKKLLEPGGALEKEFTLRAFPDAREAGALIDTFRSFAKMRERELLTANDQFTINSRQLLNKDEETYIKPLKRKATVTDLGGTIFDPFKFGPSMVLRLPEPSESMKSFIEKEVEEGIKRGEQVMPVKSIVSLPEIKGRKYVTSETGEILPSTVSRYMSELVEATRRYYQLASNSKDPEVVNLKKIFINEIVGDFYNKFHNVRDMNVKKDLLEKLEEQVMPVVGEMKMPQFKATSNLLLDPNDPSKVYFPTIYNRLDDKTKKLLEEKMKEGISIKEAYTDIIKPSLPSSETNMRFLARMLRDFLIAPMVYAQPDIIGQTARTNVGEGTDPRYRVKELLSENALNNLVKEFKHYEVERDAKGSIAGVRTKSALDIQYEEIRRNLQAYYDELGRMVYGKGLLADVALKKKIPAVYLTAQQRPYDVSDELRYAINMINKNAKHISDAEGLTKELGESLNTVEQFKLERPSQWVKKGEVRIGERDLKELQKAGQATPELQDKADQIYALINRQPTTDEFSYRAMRLIVDDFLKDLSGIMVVPGLPVGNHPVMQSMEKAYKALEELREVKLKQLESEFDITKGSTSKKVQQLQKDIDEIDKLSKDLRPMYHEFSMGLDFDGDMMSIHAATTKEANEELKRIHKQQVKDYGDTRRFLYEELSYVPEKKRSLGAKGAKFTPEELAAIGFGPVSAYAPIQPEEGIDQDPLQKIKKIPWEPLDIEFETSKVARKNLLDIHETAPDVIAEDTLKHFVHKLEMGQGYEAWNRIGFLYRGAEPKGLGITPELHETYNLLMGEFLRNVLGKVIGGKHGSEGSDLSPQMQKAFFTGDLDVLVKESRKDKTGYMGEMEENLEAYRRKFLRPMSLEQLGGEAAKYGVPSEGKSRDQLIEDIIQKTSFRSMFEHVFDQVRRMSVASLQEQYRTGLATSSTLSKLGSLGLAKFLAGREGFEGESLQSLGLRTKFKFNEGDFKALVDKKDVTDFVIAEMQKEMKGHSVGKKDVAFRIASLGEGIDKVRRGEIGELKEEIVEPGTYISTIYKGLQPMYKLKSSGGASMATSSYAKKSAAPNMFTPGGPALSYAEVLDSVIRSQAGMGIKVEPTIGTYGSVAEQTPYIFNSPAMQAYKEFMRTRKRITDVMTPEMFRFEGMMELMPGFGKETEGVIGNIRKAGSRVAYDKETQQIYLDQGLKMEFENNLREYALARTRADRKKYKNDLDETMSQIQQEVKRGASYKYIDIGEGPQADDLRERISKIADPKSKWRLKLDDIIEKIVADVKVQPRIADYLEKTGRPDMLSRSNIEVVAYLRKDPQFRKFATEEIAASYLSGGSGYGFANKVLTQVAQQGKRLWGNDRVISIDEQVNRGIIGKYVNDDFRAFSLMFRDKWLETAENYAKRPTQEEWMSIYKAHPLLRELPVPTYNKPYEDVIEDLRKEGVYGGSKGATHYINRILKDRMAQIIQHMKQPLPEDWEELRFDKLSPYVSDAIHKHAEEAMWPFRAAPRKGSDIESILGSMGKPVGKARADVERVYSHAFDLTKNQWRQIFAFDPEAQKIALTSKEPLASLEEAGMYGQNRGYTRYINMIFKKRMEYILHEIEAEKIPDFYTMRFQKSKLEFLKVLEEEALRKGEFPSFVSAGGPWGGTKFGPREAFGPNAPSNITGGLAAYVPSRQFPVVVKDDHRFVDLESSAFTDNYRKVIDRIKKAAEESGIAENVYLGGGALRNVLMGQKPRDLDIWVEGKDNLQKLTEKLKEFKKFDWVDLFGWNYFKFPEEGVSADITYTQKDKYRRSRFTNLQRRFLPPEGSLDDTVRELDFTGNAMQMRLSDYKLVDMLRGSDDIRKGILRAINPTEQFRQLPLGLVRNARFETLYGLTPDYFTETMMKRDAPLVDSVLKIQMERELNKIPAQKINEFKTVLSKYGMLTSRIDEIIGQHMEKPEGESAFAPATPTDELMTPSQNEAINKIKLAANKLHLADKVFMSGGAVRNMLIGQSPRDIDLVIEGKDKMKQLWKELKEFNVITPNNLFGYKLLRIPTSSGESVPIDIAYSAVNKHMPAGGWGLTGSRGRKFSPFTKEASIDEAARENDFTSNALYMRLSDMDISDPLGAGQKDLERKTLRAIQPTKLFRKFPTSLIKAARFETTLGLEPDVITQAYMKRDAELVNQAPRDQVLSNMYKIPDNQLGRFKEILAKYDLNTEYIMKLFDVRMARAKSKAEDHESSRAAVPADYSSHHVGYALGGATITAGAGYGAVRDIKKALDSIPFTEGQLKQYILTNIPRGYGAEASEQYVNFLHQVMGEGKYITAESGIFDPLKAKIEDTGAHPKGPAHAWADAKAGKIGLPTEMHPEYISAKEHEFGHYRLGHGGGHSVAFDEVFKDDTVLQKMADEKFMQDNYLQKKYFALSREVEANKNAFGHIKGSWNKGELISYLDKSFNNFLTYSMTPEMQKEFNSWFNAKSGIALSDFASEVPTLGATEKIFAGLKGAAKGAGLASLGIGAAYLGYKSLGEENMQTFVPADYPHVKPIYQYPHFMGEEASLQYKSHGDQVKLSAIPLRWGNVEIGYATKRKPIDPKTATAVYKPYIEEVNREIVPNLKELAKTEGRIDLFGEWGGLRDKLVWYDAKIKGKTLTPDEFYKFAKKANILPAEELYRGITTPEIVDAVFKSQKPFKGLEEGVVAKALSIDAQKDFPKMAKFKTKEYLTEEESRFPWLTSEDARRNIESKHKQFLEWQPGRPIPKYETLTLHNIVKLMQEQGERVSSGSDANIYTHPDFQDLVVRVHKKDKTDTRIKELREMFNSLRSTGLFPDTWQVKQSQLMKKVHGKTFEELLDEQSIDSLLTRYEGAARRLVAKGYTQKDTKPSNVMMTDTGEVVFIDPNSMHKIKGDREEILRNQIKRFNTKAVNQVYKSAYSPIRKPTEEQLEEELYPEDWPTVDITKERAEQYLSGLDDKFFRPPTEAGFYKKGTKFIVKAPGVEPIPSFIKDAVVMKTEEVKKTIFGEGIPEDYPYDEVLVLNARRLKPEYPEAVPISKEPGFMFPKDAKPGDVGKFIIHQHDAKRAGPHQDVRIQIGNQEELQSWAVPQKFPEEAGQRRLAIGPTAHHALEYYHKGAYEIPSPFYGAGTMKTADVGTAVLESIKEDHIVIKLQGVGGLADGTYAFIKYEPKDKKGAQRQWILQKVRPLEERDPARYKEIYGEEVVSKENQLRQDLKAEYYQYIEEEFRRLREMMKKSGHSKIIKDIFSVRTTPDLSEALNGLIDELVIPKQGLSGEALQSQLNAYLKRFTKNDLKRVLGDFRVVSNKWKEPDKLSGDVLRELLSHESTAAVPLFESLQGVNAWYDPDDRSFAVNPIKIKELEILNKRARRQRRWYDHLLMESQPQSEKKFLKSFSDMGWTAQHEMSHRNVDDYIKEQNLGTLWRLHEAIQDEPGAEQLVKTSQRVLLWAKPWYKEQLDYVKDKESVGFGKSLGLNELIAAHKGDPILTKEGYAQNKEHDLTQILRSTLLQKAKKLPAEKAEEFIQAEELYKQLMRRHNEFEKREPGRMLPEDPYANWYIEPIGSRGIVSGKFNPGENKISIDSPQSRAELRSFVNVLAHEYGHAAINEISPELAKDIIAGKAGLPGVDTEKLRKYFVNKYGDRGGEEGDADAANALEEAIAGGLRTDEDQEILNELALIQDQLAEKSGYEMVGATPIGELSYLRKSLDKQNPYVLYTDAASRHNPGPSGAGTVLLDPSGKNISEISQYLGRMTSVAAEYNALIIGLKDAMRHSAKDLLVKSDSQVMVKQLNDEFKVRNQNLKELKAQVDALRGGFDSLQFTFIPRGQNKRADILANMAIDEHLKKNAFTPSSTGMLMSQGTFAGSNIEQLIKSGAIKTDDSVFRSRGLSKDRNLDYLKHGYAIGMSGQKDVYIPSEVINAFQNEKDPKIKSLYASAIATTYEHEKIHTDINQSASEVRNLWKQRVTKEKRVASIVDDFISEAMHSTSADVYKKQFESAQRRSGEKVGNYMQSPAARWEALQEIIAGHPETSSSKRNAAAIADIRSQFYREAYPHRGKRAFAPLEGVEDISQIKGGFDVGPLSIGASIGIPNMIDMLTGLPIMETANIYAGPHLRGNRILGAPQRLLENYSPQAVGLLRQGVSKNNLLGVSPSLSIGPYSLDSELSTFGYGVGARGLESDIGIGLIPQEDRPINEVGMHPNTEYGLLKALKGIMESFKGFRQPTVGIHEPLGIRRLASRIYAAIGGDENYRWPTTIDPRGMFNQGVSDIRDWWHMTNNPIIGAGQQPYANIWEYVRSEPRNALRPIWQDFGQGITGLPRNINQRTRDFINRQRQGAVSGYREVMGQRPYRGPLSIDRNIERLEEVLRNANDPQIEQAALSELIGDYVESMNRQIERGTPLSGERAVRIGHTRGRFTGSRSMPDFIENMQQVTQQDLMDARLWAHDPIISGAAHPANAAPTAIGDEIISRAREMAWLNLRYRDLRGTLPLIPTFGQRALRDVVDIREFGSDLWTRGLPNMWQTSRTAATDIWGATRAFSSGRVGGLPLSRAGLVRGIFGGLNPFQRTSGMGFGVGGTIAGPTDFLGQFDTVASDMLNVDSFVGTLRQLFSSAGARHIVGALGNGEQQIGVPAGARAVQVARGRAIVQRLGGLTGVLQKPWEAAPALINIGRGSMQGLAEFVTERAGTAMSNTAHLLQTGSPLEILGATGRGLMRNLPVIGQVATGAYDIKQKITEGEDPFTSITSEIVDQLISAAGVAAGGTMGIRSVDPLIRLLTRSSGKLGGGPAGRLIGGLGLVAGSIGGGIAAAHLGEKVERGIFHIGAGKLGPRSSRLEAWKQQKEQARLDEDNLEKILPDYISPEELEKLDKIRNISPYVGIGTGTAIGGMIGAFGSRSLLPAFIGTAAGAAIGSLTGKSFGDWYYNRGRRKARQAYYEYKPYAPIRGPEDTEDVEPTYAPIIENPPLSAGMKWRIPPEIELMASNSLKGKPLDEIINKFRGLQNQVESQLPGGGSDLSSRKSVIAKLSRTYIEQLESLRDELNTAAKNQDKNAVANISKEIDEYIIKYVVNVLRSSSGMGGIHPLSDPYRVRRVGGFVGSDDNQSVTLGRPQAFDDVLSLDSFYSKGLEGIARKIVIELRRFSGQGFSPRILFEELMGAIQKTSTNIPKDVSSIHAYLKSVTHELGRSPGVDLEELRYWKSMEEQFKDVSKQYRHMGRFEAKSSGLPIESENRFAAPIIPAGLGPESQREGMSKQIEYYRQSIAQNNELPTGFAMPIDFSIKDEAGQSIQKFRAELLKTGNTMDSFQTQQIQIRKPY